MAQIVIKRSTAWFHTLSLFTFWLVVHRLFKWLYYKFWKLTGEWLNSNGNSEYTHVVLGNFRTNFIDPDEPSKYSTFRDSCFTEIQTWYLSSCPDRTILNFGFIFFVSWIVFQNFWFLWFVLCYYINFIIKEVVKYYFLFS